LGYYFPNYQSIKEFAMGWRKYNEALDRAVPQPGDSAGDIIGKAITSWIAAPMALLDLFEPEPSSGGGSPQNVDNRSGGGGCHCDCESHWT
jgi:hypothetical protein